MAGLRIGFKILLFCSAYTPLFFILILKLMSQIFYGKVNITTLAANSTNQNYFLFFPTFGTIIIFFILLIVIIIPNLILLIILGKTKKTSNPLSIKIEQIKEMNYIYIGYLMSYVIPFISFNFFDVFDVLALIFLLFVVCFIYIKSNLLYVNFMFNIFGYNLLKVRDSRNEEYRIISRRKVVLKDDIISISPISDESERFYLEVGVG